MEIKKIGVVIADDWEFKPFKERSAKFNAVSGNIKGFETTEFNVEDKKIIGIKCLNGKVNAAAVTAMLIMKENPDVIMNIGLSGAVKGVKRGTVFAGKSFQECDFDLTALDYELGVKPDQEYVYFVDDETLSLIPQKYNIPALRCGTGDLFLTKNEVKADFYEKFGINTFDMETAAIASVCHNCNTPFLSIRKVSDDSEDSYMEDYRGMNELSETALSDIIIDVIKNA